MATWYQQTWCLIKEWWVIPVAIIAWLFYAWLLPIIGPNADTKIGAWGDSFGGFNALVSGLAFFVLIKTLLTQKDELRLQRKELEATRKVLNHQREELAEQRFVMKKEAFERTFFQFLEMVDQAYHSPESAYGGNPFEDIMRPDMYDKNEYRLVVGVKSFFSLLSTILEFIDQMGGPDADKRLYCSILRDRIGEKGLQPFLWAGTKPDWCKENQVIENISRFQELTEKYKFFSTIRHQSLEILFYEYEIYFSIFYRQTAFGERSDLDEFYSQQTIDELVGKGKYEIKK